MKIWGLGAALWVITTNVTLAQPAATFPADLDFPNLEFDHNSLDRFDRQFEATPWLAAQPDSSLGEYLAQDPALVELDDHFPQANVTDRLISLQNRWLLYNLEPQSSNINVLGSPSAEAFADVAAEALALDFARTNISLEALSLAAGFRVERTDIEAVQDQILTQGYLDDRQLTLIEVLDGNGLLNLESEVTGILVGSGNPGWNQHVGPGEGVDPPALPGNQFVGTRPVVPPATGSGGVAVASLDDRNWSVFIPDNPELTEPGYPVPEANAALAPNNEFPSLPWDVPTDQDFLQLVVQAADPATGKVAIPFFRSGFADAVIVRTGEDATGICSGTIIKGGFVITAAHCVRQFPGAGSVHAVESAQIACLNRYAEGDFPDQHVVDACQLRELLIAREQPPATFAVGQDGLALLRLTDDDLPSQVSDIGAMFNTNKALVTMVGYGQSSAREFITFGTLQVAWAFVSLGDFNFPHLPEFFIIDLTRPVGACSGDSGGGVFRGRLFGYADPTGFETRELLGVVSRAQDDISQCRDADIAPQTGSGAKPTAVISTQSPEVLEWLCAETENALSVCIPPS